MRTAAVGGRRSRSACGALLAAAAGAALTFGAVPAAQAADACPNAAVRAQQNATRLPDCRAFELVSPVDKNGHKVKNTNFVSPRGGAVHFFTAGAFPGGPSNLGSEYAAHRTDTGWTTTSFVPAFDGDRISRLSDVPSAMAFSSDLRRAVIRTTYPLYPSDTGGTASQPRASTDLFIMEGGGRHTWISRGADASLRRVAFVAASDDLSTVLMRTGRQLDPAVPDETVEHLYLHRAGRPTALVSAGSDGRPLPTAPGAAFMSADGSRIVFDAGMPFVFDSQSGTSAEPVFGPDRRVCASGTVSALSRDGRRLLFSCSTQLTDDAPAGSALYLGDLDTGAIVSLGIDGTVIGATDDLSRGYVTNLTGLYRYGRGPTERVVTTVGGGGNITAHQPLISPNGEYLAFKTQADLGHPTSLYGEVYLYSDLTGELECLTCMPDGSSFDDNGYIQALNSTANGQVTDAGDVFYTAASALVPTDQNGRFDAYLWRDGRPHLLSSGTHDADSFVVSAADDGREVFLISSEGLAPQDVDNGTPDLYVARVGGGFLAPDAPPVCTSGCQGEPQPFGMPPAPGTAQFTGPGDRDDAEEPAVAKVFSLAPIGARARANWARRGRTAIRVELSHAGTVRAVVRARIGRKRPVVASAARTAASGGTVRLTLRLSRRARSELRRQGSLRLALRVTYSGRAGAQQTTLTLRSATAGKAAR